MTSLPQPTKTSMETGPSAQSVQAEQDDRPLSEGHQKLEAGDKDKLLEDLSTSSSMAEEKQCDLECVICFSIYNNVFRTPKQLACGHTFCLECLARMNMKAQVAENIQCPMCRKLTTVPKDGLPKLGNDSKVLSCLPETMQRIHSIHFNRGKGRLFLKKGLGSQKKAVKKKIFVSSVSQSLDVGQPSEPGGQRQHREGSRRCLRNKFYLGVIFVITATLSVLIGSIWVFVVH